VQMLPKIMMVAVPRDQHSPCWGIGGLADGVQLMAVHELTRMAVGGAGGEFGRGARRACGWGPSGN